MTETGDRLRLMFDWASAQQGSRRLALWIVVAVLLHGAAYVLCRVSYPSPTPTRISDATLYVLLPDSVEARSLAPFLAAADPALFAPEANHGVKLPTPPIPAYEPSYAVAKPQLEPLPDVQPRVLPPLIRDFGPITVEDASVAAPPQPAPAANTQVQFSATLQGRSPRQWPRLRFVARPGDQLAPMRFLIAVAPDGRVLHVVRDADPSGITPGDDNKAIDEAAARFLTDLWFQRGQDSSVTWGTATFYWGLDVKREELR